MEEVPDMCSYDPSKDIDYYTSAIASMMRFIVGGGKSTHAYVKEVRKALETLVFDVWDRADQYVLTLATANIPDKIISLKARKCFEGLLTGLLKRFYETTRDLPVGARIKLMNMIIASIAEMARTKPPPSGELVVRSVFSKQQSLDPLTGGGDN